MLTFLTLGLDRPAPAAKMTASAPSKALGVGDPISKSPTLHVYIIPVGAFYYYGIPAYVLHKKMGTLNESSAFEIPKPFLILSP